MTPCVEASLLVRKELTEASYPHLMLEFRMFSALATIIANEHSDDDFTTTTGLMVHRRQPCARPYQR